RCLRQSCLNGSGQRFRYHGSMTELDQCQFRIVDLGMLTRQIAEPEIERDAPDNADNAEEPEDMPPVWFRMNRYLVGAVRFIEERQDNERSDPAGESARHPHGPLSEAALVEGEPVVERAGNIRIRPGFTDAEEETYGEHRIEGEEGERGSGKDQAGQCCERRPP